MSKMGELAKIKTVFKFTVKEVIQSKILFNVIILGVFLLTVTAVAFQFTYGTPSRVALDFGLGTLSLSAVAISLFMGISLISNEIESRTIYMVLSRPISRGGFILGKYLGLAFVVILNIIILAAITLSLFLFTGGSLTFLIMMTLVFIIIEALLLLAMVCVFSLITNKVMTVLLSLTIYLIGHSIAAAQGTSLVKNNTALEKLLDLYHFVLPGFYKLNLKDYVLYEQKISNNYIWMNLSYGIIYILFLLALTTYIFKRKNLD